MRKHLVLLLAVLLVLASGCRIITNDEPPLGLDTMPEADEYPFTDASYYIMPHKAAFEYTETKALGGFELITLEDGTDRIAMSSQGQSELQYFPAVEVSYDSQQLVLTLTIYSGTPGFVALWALEEATVFSEFTLETHHAGAPHGGVHRYRTIELELNGPIQYKMYWSETHGKVILDIQPLTD